MTVLGIIKHPVAVAWERARPIDGRDPAIWRMDDIGALIYREAYDNPSHEYGWEIVEVPAAEDSDERFKPRHF